MIFNELGPLIIYQIGPINPLSSQDFLRTLLLPKMSTLFTFPPISSRKLNPQIPTHRRNMEPHRPIARRLHRKPLGDCTNTVSRTTKQQSSSSSSVVKFANPSLTSSLKRLVDQTSLKERNNNDSSKTSPRFVPKSLSTSLRPVTRRVSADLCFPATTPSRRQNSRSGEGKLFHLLWVAV